MALVEKPSREDLLLYEVLRNPAWCAEFIYNMDKVNGLDEEFSFTWYQDEILCDFNSYVSICTSRASGKCLEESSMILNPSTGEYKTIKDWFFDGNLDSIVAIGDDWKNKNSTCRIEPNGIKDCLEISTVGGYKTTVTFEHPILTNYGFVQADKLKVGDYIACGKEIPFFGNDATLTDPQIKILAHFIAEGTYHCGSITTTDEAVISDINEYADSIGYNVRKEIITYHITGGKANFGLSSQYLEFLTEHGLRDKHSFDKFIPQSIFRLPKEKLGLFLNRLFSDDGWCMDSDSHCHIGYASTSETLVRNIRHLLLRFGIKSAIVFKKNKFLGSWSLTIMGKDQLERFKSNIGFCIKYKSDKLDSCISKLKVVYNQADVLPIPNYSKYKILEEKSGWKTSLNYFPTRIKAQKVINKDDLFNRFENADIYWTKITSIITKPDRDTYAVKVDKYNTHLVDDIWSHNTVALSSLIIWALIFRLFPEDYILYTVPSKVHLEPVFTNLIRQFRSNSFLKNFIDKKSGVNSSDYKITLLSQSTLLCRIAGQSGTGANLIGLHTPLILTDEAGYYPLNAFNEMQPALNVWTTGYKEMVTGVPTGLRENNILYLADQENKNYTKHRVSSYDNPRITKEDEERAIEQYGGKDTDDFIHLFLGLHGKPVFSIFDRNLFRIDTYPVFKLDINGIQHNDNLEEILSKIASFPVIKSGNYGIFMGIDLGYTEPTAIIIMYRDSNDCLKFHGRIKLTKVSYPIQEKLIDLLDTKFQPELIGIDRGGAGVSVVQNLLEHRDFLHKDFKNKIYPIDFSSSTTIGISSDGTEIKTKTKVFTVSVLQEYSNNQKIIYSSTDMDMVSELERMTYTKNIAGDITYKTMTERGGKKGEDHFTASLLCLTGAYHLSTNFGNRVEKKKLLTPTWI